MLESTFGFGSVRVKTPISTYLVALDPNFPRKGSTPRTGVVFFLLTRDGTIVGWRYKEYAWISPDP